MSKKNDVGIQVHWPSPSRAPRRKNKPSSLKETDNKLE
jgi:hypothetical protein